MLALHFLQDMAVCVKTIYILIMGTFLATMLALHFLPRHGCVCEMLYTLMMTTFVATMLALQSLARHGCACQNPLYPYHDYISGHHVGLTFSCQDMIVCVKELYTLIMTTVLATMLALHFLAKTWLCL